VTHLTSVSVLCIGKANGPELAIGLYNVVTGCQAVVIFRSMACPAASRSCLHGGVYIA
jgi:hypothetical protein